MTGGITVDLDTRGTIDVAAERARLEKDRAAAEKEAAQCRAKLGNDAFVGKAPEQVVAKIKDRLATAEADLDADRRGPGGVADRMSPSTTRWRPRCAGAASPAWSSTSRRSGT